MSKPPAMIFQNDEEIQEEKQKHPWWRHALILISAFMINFTVGGLLFGFGVYQALYETMALEQGTPFSHASSAIIDLIGALSISLLTIGAPFAVAWAKYFGPRPVVCAGGLLFGLANILASFGKEMWHFHLTQGLLLGLGSCLAYVTSMTVAPTWFEKHRGLAMGCISAGTGVGGLVWAPVITVSIQHLGFRTTLRLMGALAAGLICASGSILVWEPSMAAHLRKQDTADSWIQGFLSIPLPTWKMIKQRKFIAQALSAAFQSGAYYTPVFFIVSYAKTLGYSEADGADFTAASNACNAIGKITVGFVADRMGRLNSFFLTTFLSAIVTLGLWVSSTAIGSSNEEAGRALFISFTVLYGLFASAFVSLFPAVLVELFGVRELPRVSGVMYLMQGLAAIVGTPVAGALVRGDGTAKNPENYMGMAIMTGALMLAATGTVAWIRFEVLMDKGGGGWLRNWKV